MTKFSYMQRLEERKALVDLKAQTMFGLVLGWLMLLIGLFHYLFLLDQPAFLWLALSIIGLMLLVVTIVLPGLNKYPQTVMRSIAQFVGELLLKIVLAILYFLVITPMGLLLQLNKGKSPIYAWQGNAPANMEGWVKKETTAFVVGEKQKRSWTNMFTMPFEVLAYFMQHKQLVLLPCLLIILVISVIGVFVQSSALLPFIYTLF